MAITSVMSPRFTSHIVSFHTLNSHCANIYLTYMVLFNCAILFFSHYLKNENSFNYSARQAKPSIILYQRRNGGATWCSSVSPQISTTHRGATRLNSFGQGTTYPGDDKAGWPIRCRGVSETGLRFPLLILFGVDHTIITERPKRRVMGWGWWVT
jgi:hypothetical protein